MIGFTAVRSQHTKAAGSTLETKNEMLVDKKGKGAPSAPNTEFKEALPESYFAGSNNILPFLIIS